MASTHSNFAALVFFRMSKVDSMDGASCEKSSKLTGILCGSRALRADVRCEFLVELLFVMNLHLVNRFANGWTQRIKHPCAFGASPALKILSFGPYQFATHRLHDTPRDVVGYATLKGRRGIGLDGTATTKAAPFIVLSEVLRKLPLLEHTSRPR
jgi:hypothetical protein